MKKSMIIAGAMMVLGASIASAQGEINLAWTDCNATGTPSTTFLCNSNAGLSSLVGSFVAPGTLPEFLGISVDMNFQFTCSPDIPLWWQHGPRTRPGTRRTARRSGRVRIR